MSRTSPHGVGSPGRNAIERRLTSIVTESAVSQEEEEAPPISGVARRTTTNVTTCRDLNKTYTPEECRKFAAIIDSPKNDISDCNETVLTSLDNSISLTDFCDVIDEKADFDKVMLKLLQKVGHDTMLQWFRLNFDSKDLLGNDEAGKDDRSPRPLLDNKSKDSIGKVEIQKRAAMKLREDSLHLIWSNQYPAPANMEGAKLLPAIAQIRLVSDRLLAGEKGLEKKREKSSITKNTNILRSQINLTLLRFFFRQKNTKLKTLKDITADMKTAFQDTYEKFRECAHFVEPAGERKLQSIKNDVEKYADNWLGGMPSELPSAGLHIASAAQSDSVLTVLQVMINHHGAQALLEEVLRPEKNQTLRDGLNKGESLLKRLSLHATDPTEMFGSLRDYDEFMAENKFSIHHNDDSGKMIVAASDESKTCYVLLPLPICDNSKRLDSVTELAGYVLQAALQQGFPNQTLAVYDCGIMENERESYAFVEVEKGVGLDQYLRNKNIPVDFPRKLLRSLQLLHALLGFTHLDVKIENIVVVPRGHDLTLVFTHFGRSVYGHQTIHVPLEEIITTIPYTPLDVALGCTLAAYTQAIDMHPTALVLLSLCLGKDIFLHMDENSFSVDRKLIQYLADRWETDECRSHIGKQLTNTEDGKSELAKAVYRTMVLISLQDDLHNPYKLAERLDKTTGMDCELENFFLTNDDCANKFIDDAGLFSLDYGSCMTVLKNHPFIEAVGIRSLICCLDPNQAMRLTPTEMLELCQN